MDSTVIAARSDLQAIAAWLARFAETQTTFDNYRKEAERLLLRGTVELRKPLSPLTHEDLLGYQRFLADPQPAGRWVFPKGRKPSRADAAWRPLLTIAGKPKPLTRSALHGIIKRASKWLPNGWPFGKKMRPTKWSDCAEPRRTGCATQRDRVWPMRRWICGMYGTTWDTNP